MSFKKDQSNDEEQYRNIFDFKGSVHIQPHQFTRLTIREPSTGRLLFDLKDGKHNTVRIDYTITLDSSQIQNILYQATIQKQRTHKHYFRLLYYISTFVVRKLMDSKARVKDPNDPRHEFYCSVIHGILQRTLAILSKKERTNMILELERDVLEEH